MMLDNLLKLDPFSINKKKKNKILKKKKHLT